MPVLVLIPLPAYIAYMNADMCVKNKIGKWLLSILLFIPFTALAILFSPITLLGGWGMTLGKICHNLKLKL